MRILSPVRRAAPAIMVLLALALLPVVSAVAQSGSGATAKTEAGAAIAARVTWTTIEFQTFEGAFPSGSWAVWDYNGSTVGGDYTWDDVTTHPYSGAWSVHPAAGTIPYPSVLHSVMQFGSFSLIGARDARVKFNYWLDSEQGVDYLSYGYSCDSGQTWKDTSVSGSNGWKAVTMSIKACKGKPSVAVHWVFVSDYSFEYEGAYIDDVRIQKH